MNKEDGLKEIIETKWIKDNYSCLNLFVTDSKNRSIHCFLNLRPSYCDRGHIQLNIDGDLDIDGADSFPRFFFNFKEADLHVRTFLMWRLWKHRVYEHKLEIE